MGKLINLSGKFGRLTVLSRNGSTADKQARWLCRWATDTEQVANRRLKRIEAFSDDEIRAEFNRRFTPWQA